MLADRVGVSVATVAKLEDGNPSTMLRVLTVLGLNAEVDLLAAEDALGRSLQDSQLKWPVSVRSARRNPSAAPVSPPRTGAISP
jgi:hypothetical protein